MSLAVLGNPPDCLRASAFANGVVQALGYDPVSRLTSLTNQLSGTAQDLTKTYTYNPASQITQQTTSNDAYAFVKSNVSETGTANGLNQLTTYAAKTLTHDTKGNITGFGTDTFAYSSENLLTSATVGGTATTLAYDPLLRLYQSVPGATTSRFAYDGLDAIAEYNGAGALQRRWVFDPTTGQALVWYEGTGTAATDRRYLSADERGSIISVSDRTGASLGINTYDEFGNPAAANLGRFGYTGQAWIGSAKLWYYKARMYAPQIGGRFLQPDPIGYWDSPNLYAYVLNDPVNWVDPLGFWGTGLEGQDHPDCKGADICVTGTRSFSWILQGLRGPSMVIGSSDPMGAGGGGGGEKDDPCQTRVNGAPSPAEAAEITKRETQNAALTGAARGVGIGGPLGALFGAFGGYAAVGLQRLSDLRTGGRWDPGESAAGNRIYGAVTVALGIPREAALRFSGFYEQYGEPSNNPYDPKWGRFSDPSGNFGNRPETIQAIDEGRKCAI